MSRQGRYGGPDRPGFDLVSWEGQLEGLLGMYGRIQGCLGRHRREGIRGRLCDILVRCLSRSTGRDGVAGAN